jgi:hypothetical protein
VGKTASGSGVGVNLGALGIVGVGASGVNVAGMAAAAVGAAGAPSSGVEASVSTTTGAAVAGSVSAGDSVLSGAEPAPGAGRTQAVKKRSAISDQSASVAFMMSPS